MGINFGLSFIHAEKLLRFSGTSAKMVTEPLQNQRCARNSFPIWSLCILRQSHAVFAQVFKHNLRRTPPSERRTFGSVVKPRRRARARHPQARECRGGPPHLEVRLNRVWRPRTSCPRPISVGPSFFKQLWQVPEVAEAAAAGQHQGLGVSCLAVVRQPKSTGPQSITLDRAQPDPHTS